jgi:hypothetical protein
MCVARRQRNAAATSETTLAEQFLLAACGLYGRRRGMWCSNIMRLLESLE